MSGLVNKVKDALHSDKKSHNTSSAPEGTHGPHSSRAANAADPRVDSDRDHRAAPGTHGHTTAHTTHTAGTSGGVGLSSTGPTSSSYATSGTHEPGLSSGLHEGAYDSNRGVGGPASRTDGPHSSNLANKVDPRVDSDRDYSRNMGANPSRSAETGNTHHSSGGLGSSTHHSSGHTAGLGHSSGAPEGTYGQHNSRLANAADPRIDSDSDGSRTVGGNNLGSSTGHTTGHHSSTTTGGLTGSSYTPGPAPNTAGPHKSDMLNKADPRVDSNLDGSKTVGGNKTYAQ